MIRMLYQRYVKLIDTAKVTSKNQSTWTEKDKKKMHYLEKTDADIRP